MKTEDDRTARLLDALYADDLPTEEAVRIRAAIDADPEARAQLAAWSAVRAVAARLPMREPDPQVRYEILRAARQSPHLEKKVGFFERLWQWSLNPVVAGVGLLLVAGSVFVVYSGRQDATPDRFAAPGAGAPTASTPTATQPKQANAVGTEFKPGAANAESETAKGGDGFAAVDDLNQGIAARGETAQADRPAEGGAAGGVLAVAEPESAPKNAAPPPAPPAEPAPDAVPTPKAAAVQPEPVEVPALARGSADSMAAAGLGSVAAGPADKAELADQAEESDRDDGRLGAKGGGKASAKKVPAPARPTVEAPRARKADDRAEAFGTGGLANAAGGPAGADGYEWSGDSPAPEPARRAKPSAAPAKSKRGSAKENPESEKKSERPARAMDGLFDDAPTANAPSPFPAAGESSPPVPAPVAAVDAVAAPEMAVQATTRGAEVGAGRATSGASAEAKDANDVAPASPHRAGLADSSPAPVVAALEEERSAAPPSDDVADEEVADELVADAESNRKAPARPMAGAPAAVTATATAGETAAATLTSARQLRDAGRLAEAAQAYETVIAGGGRQADEAAFEAAAVYERLGNRARATALYVRVGKSNSANAANARARLSAMDGSRD